eukprot:scaffold76054_cov57-Phaeocystis_antarctica.AAC.1
MMSESQTIDEDASMQRLLSLGDASMQRLLTEAYAELEFEEPAKVPGSVYVKRCPKETIKEKTGMEETVDQRRLNRSRGAHPNQRRLNRREADRRRSRGASTGAEAPQPKQRRLNRIRVTNQSSSAMC